MMGGLLGDVSALTWTGTGILSLGGAVAPSFGHFYARNIFRASLMTGIRTAFIAAAVIPQIVYNASSDSEFVGLRAEGHFIFVVLPVSVTAAALAIMDILTIRRSVRRGDAAYLRIAAPVFDVISAGAFNRFGMPHRSVLQRLSERHIRVLRTDTNGAICFRTDGRVIEIGPFDAFD